MFSLTARFPVDCNNCFKHAQLLLILAVFHLKQKAIDYVTQV